jgi:hypothetical protein
VVSLEALLEHGGLVLGQPQLLARAAVVVLVAAAGRPLRRRALPAAAARRGAACRRAPSSLRRGSQLIRHGGNGIIIAGGVTDEAGLRHSQAEAEAQPKVQALRRHVHLIPSQYLSFICVGYT